MKARKDVVGRTVGDGHHRRPPAPTLLCSGSTRGIQLLALEVSHGHVTSLRFTLQTPLPPSARAAPVVSAVC